ncbi:MAG: hypothetical protein KTR15_07420 [Phycisphaeraceae bacterium]|nr:hypothetical protein [Phycisphaeraceae bacterium]
MGWARTLLLGDIGNRLDIEDTERDIQDVRRELRAGRYADQTQDQQIAALQQENEELEICVASLIKLLEGKGVVSAEEVNKLVMRVEM